MWTVRRSNRVARAAAVFVAVMLAAIVAAPLARDGHPVLAVLAGVAAAVVFVALALRRWRNAPPGSLLAHGKAATEREAYLLLCAWAFVGQVAVAAVMVEVVVEAYTRPRPGVGFVLLIVLGAAQLGSTWWLMSRDKRQ
jgi:membrane protease YdiL (CAAX protease family)